MALERLETDILILGSGGAGLFAALHALQADPDLDVTVAVKPLNCGWLPNVTSMYGASRRHTGLIAVIDNTPGIWQDPENFATPIQTAYVNWGGDEPSSTANENSGSMRSNGTWNDFGDPTSITPLADLVAFL
jgi:hypothetical protein